MNNAPLIDRPPNVKAAIAWLSAPLFWVVVWAIVWIAW